MKLVRFILSLVLFGFLSFGLWKGIGSTDLLKLKTVEVTGADLATESRIRKIINIKPGDKFWEQSLENQAQDVEKDSWVESARIRRVFPNTLEVEIQQRKPYAVVGDEKGRFAFADSNNNILGRADPGKIGAYPILLGVGFEKNPELRNEALDLIKALPDHGWLSRADLSDLRYDDEHGFQIHLAKSGILVDIGKDNIPLHLDRARRVVQYLDQHSINASRVDSDYAKKVLVKVRKDR